QFVYQLIQFAFGRHLIELLADGIVEERAVFERTAKSLAQIVEVLVEILKSRVRIVEAGVEQVIGERLKKILQIDLRCQVAFVLGVLNALHCNFTPADTHAGGEAFSYTRLLGCGGPSAIRRSRFQAPRDQ